MTAPEQLNAFIGGSGPGPVFVHSDLFLASGFVEVTLDRNQLLQRHVAMLNHSTGGRALWMPTFNYDFPRSGRFDVGASPSQLGPLGEHFRKIDATWRTADPIFSVAGTQSRPDLPSSGTIDPFGPASIFGELERRRATLLFYGAPLSSATIIHYAERKMGGPPYRYDKIFRGVVVNGADHYVIEYVYHVRPLNKDLEYDWARIDRDLCKAGLLRNIQREPRSVARVIEAAPMCEYLDERLRQDPLYLLDRTSRSWVEPELSRLGRRFELRDFEPHAQ